MDSFIAEMRMEREKRIAEWVASEKKSLYYRMFKPTDEVMINELKKSIRWSDMV